MKTFTDFYLDRICEALIDKAMSEDRWMTQEEVERMHLVEYRSGYFSVRRRRDIGRGREWRVSWDNRASGDRRVYVANEGGRAVTAFERTRREVDKILDAS